MKLSKTPLQAQLNFVKMVLQAEVFIVLVVLAQTLQTGSVTIPDVSEHTFQGRFGYFAVPRDRVAAKLRELQQSSCHEEFLTLPNTPVLQDLIQPDEHIVAVVYGRLTATSLEDSLPADVKSKYETQADTVQFFIPMLTGTNPDAEPIYKLALGSFVATEKPFLQSNVAIPTKQVKSIDVTSDGLVMTDHGFERLELAWSVIGTCETPFEAVSQDFNEYIDELTVSSRHISNYPFCQEAGADQVIFCVGSDIFNGACQFWGHKEVRNCREDAFSVQCITPKFAEVSLLTDGPQDAVLTEFNEGSYRVGVQKPCIV